MSVDARIAEWQRLIETGQLPTLPPDPTASRLAALEATVASQARQLTALREEVDRLRRAAVRPPESR